MCECTKVIRQIGISICICLFFNCSQLVLTLGHCLKKSFCANRF